MARSGPGHQDDKEGRALAAARGSRPGVALDRRESSARCMGASARRSAGDIQLFLPGRPQIFPGSGRVRCAIEAARPDRTRARSGFDTRRAPSVCLSMQKSSGRFLIPSLTKPRCRTPGRALWRGRTPIGPCNRRVDTAPEAAAFLLCHAPDEPNASSMRAEDKLEPLGTSEVGVRSGDDQ